jgi:nucleoid DNA-binding protein
MAAGCMQVLLGKCNLGPQPAANGWLTRVRNRLGLPLPFRAVGIRLVVERLVMTLTKRDLVMRISEETGLIQTQVFDVIQKTLDQISEALAKGGKVELRNFGVFEVKVRKARVGRNPRQPETDVPIPARAMVKFKAGKEMKATVLKLTPKPTKKAP